MVISKELCYNSFEEDEDNYAGYDQNPSLLVKGAEVVELPP
jgi:hypothetical protein